MHRRVCLTRNYTETRECRGKRQEARGGDGLSIYNTIQNARCRNINIRQQYEDSLGLL